MKQVILYVIISYILIWNLIGFAAMGLDKNRAIKKGWRIKERTLLLIAFLGGAFGSLAGMYLFRHKIRHIKFTFLVPTAALLHIVIIIYLSINYL